MHDNRLSNKEKPLNSTIVSGTSKETSTQPNSTPSKKILEPTEKSVSVKDLREALDKILKEWNEEGVHFEDYKKLLELEKLFSAFKQGLQSKKDKLEKRFDELPLQKGYDADWRLLQNERIALLSAISVFEKLLEPSGKGE